MENKDDWSKIEKLQAKKERKKQYVDFEEFNKKDRKKVDTFNRIFTFGLTTISISAVIAGIAVFVFAFVFIYALFYICTPKDVLKSLKEEYRNEKFVIVEDYGAKDAKSKGLYLVSPKSEPNIVFKMYNTNQIRSDNDYLSHRVKYYFENCEDKELTENFYAEEFTMEYDGIDFLHYTILTKINSYNEIEERVKKIFELKDYFLSKNDKMFEVIWIEDDNLKYALSISIDTSNTLEQETYRIKYEYLEQLKENNSSILNQIDKEEIANIWKPKTLNLYINNKKVGSVSYEPLDQDYCISDLNEVLNEVGEFEITKKDITKKTIKEIKYGNKKIKVLEEDRNKKNTIYDGIELNEFCELFNANISYDYESENVYITL